MAQQMYGSNYEKHPMVAKIWEKLEDVEQHLNRLDTAVDAILKHLNIKLPDSTANGDTKASSTAKAEAEAAANSVISDEPHKYKPLDLGTAEIRLLALADSKNPEDELRGSMIHLSLDDPQVKLLKRYSALSYTWGVPNMDRRVIIDGHPLPITQNLESALRQMRKTASEGTAGGRSASRHWWIDQICINQADIEERGNQVSLMRRIYKSASNVQVWLGDGIEGSKLAMDLVLKIGRPPTRGPGEKEVTYPEFTEDEVREHWRSLRLLLSLPWWERSWIRQEVSLSSQPQVFWGEHRVDLGVVQQAVMAIEYADSLGHQILGTDADTKSPAEDGINILTFDFFDQARGLRDLRKTSHSGQMFLPLPELLLHSRHCKATDSRDKVYSVLGLADPEVYQLRANYHHSLAEVLKSTAKVVLPTKKGLRVLGTCQNPGRRHDLPSWAPNLVDGWKYRPFEPDDTRHYMSFAESSVEFDGDTMLIKGYVSDSVTTICETVVPDNPTTAQIDEVYESWQRFAEAAFEAGPLRKPRNGGKTGRFIYDDIFWLNFLSTDRMAGRFLRYSDDDKSRLMPEREEGLALEYMGLNLKLAQSYLLPASADTSLNPFRRIRSALKKYGVGRRLGLCAETPTLVLLPGDAQVGDMITVFRGATFPYILRKATEDTGVEGKDTGAEGSGAEPEGKDVGPKMMDAMVLVGEAFLPEEGANLTIGRGHNREMDALRIV